MQLIFLPVSTQAAVPKYMPNIAENINCVTARIAAATKATDHNANNIALLAVSKGQPLSAIQQAYQQGLRRFGENYLQEALDKKNQLADLADIEWHFIGPVQSNKTRKVAENFDWLHTIDRIKVAKRLNEQRPQELAPLNVCVQVNINNEDNKAGVTPEALSEIAIAITKLPRLKLRGLMAIPKATSNIEEQRHAFAKLAKLLKQLQNLSPELATLDTLSMGMSGDLEAAIAEGATLIRIGTDIFGQRQPSKHSN